MDALLKAHRASIETNERQLAELAYRRSQLLDRLESMDQEYLDAEWSTFSHVELALTEDLREVVAAELTHVERQMVAVRSVLDASQKYLASVSHHLHLLPTTDAGKPLE